MRGWIGVDLDGTLVEYNGWKGVEHIGKSVPAMVNRVKRWLAESKEVRIFTARMSGPRREQMLVTQAIDRWCREHLGQTLTVTNVKDYGMVELWDDRAVQVEVNTGRRVDGHPEPEDTSTP